MYDCRKSINEIWRYDIRNQAWMQCGARQLPSAVRDCCAVVDCEGVIHIMGGYNGGILSNHWQMTPKLLGIRIEEAFDASGGGGNHNNKTSAMRAVTGPASAGTDGHKVKKC